MNLTLSLRLTEEERDVVIPMMLRHGWVATEIVNEYGTHIEFVTKQQDIPSRDNTYYQCLHRYVEFPEDFFLEYRH
jgi:hypothetical protein